MGRVIGWAGIWVGGVFSHRHPSFPLRWSGGATPTGRRPASGCQGTIGLVTPWGSTYTLLQEAGGTLGPGDGAARVPLCSFPSFCSFSVRYFIPFPIPVPGDNNRPTDREHSAALHTQGPSPTPGCLHAHQSTTYWRPRSPRGVLMRPHFREGGAEAKEVCLRLSSKGEAEVA